MFLELNSKGLYQSSGKEKESCCLVFPSSTKREIRHFHVVVVQRRLRNVPKSVMHAVQSCCSANIHLLLFCRPCYRRRSRCLSILLFSLGGLRPKVFPSHDHAYQFGRPGLTCGQRRLLV